MSDDKNNVSSPVAQPAYYAEDTIDLVQLFRIYIKKWLLLGVISFIVAVVALVGLKFFYNKSVRTWTVDFEFEFPGVEDGLYPDGTTFRYQDFTKLSNVEKALSLDSSLASFSAEDVAKKGGLSIRENYKENAEKELVFTGVYTLTLKQSYFKSGDMAANFAEALLKAIADEISLQVDNVYYHAFIDSFDNADTFEAKLDYLVQQKEYVDAKYDEWIEAYGEQYLVDGMTLGQHKQNALLAMSDKEYDALKFELQKRQYVYKRADDEETVSKYQIEILKDEYEDNSKKIDNLTQALEELRKGEDQTGAPDMTGKPNETYYYETIATLTERQVDIEREITNINTKLSNINATAEVTSYFNKINSVRDKLERQAAILEDKVAPYLYTEKTIYNTLGIKSQGGFSAVLGAAAGFVLTYLVVGFFVFILDEDDKKKAAR